MTQQEIKDNYAKSVGYEDWDDLVRYARHNLRKIDSHINKVIQLVAQQALEKAAEKAKTDSDHPNCGVRVDKSSITNPDNIPTI